MITLRRAKPEDVMAIGEVHMTAIREACSSHYSPELVQAWATPRPTSFYLEAINSKEFYVAIEGEVIVGFGSFNQESREIEGLFVAPKFAGRGIGLKILTELEQRARVFNLGNVYLKASLNAVLFYESAGYKRREDSKHRVQSGVEIPCVIMDKELG